MNEPKDLATGTPSACHCYPSIGSRVEVCDGSEAHGDRGCVSEPREIAITGDKARVFDGTLDECQQFVRANRFSVILSQMEIQDGHVYAIRNDG
jgi:hypothetical protein